MGLLAEYVVSGPGTELGPVTVRMGLLAEMVVSRVGLLTDAELMVVPKVGLLTDAELTVVPKVGLLTEAELIVVPRVGLLALIVEEVSKYGTQPGRLKFGPVFPELPYTMQL